MGHLAVIFAEGKLAENETRTPTKMTAKCPMDLDVEKLSRVPCDHFDPYMTYFAQSHKKLQHISFLLVITAKNLFISVRSYVSVHIRRIVMKSL